MHTFLFIMAMRFQLIRYHSWRLLFVIIYRKLYTCCSLDNLIIITLYDSCKHLKNPYNYFLSVLFHLNKKTVKYFSGYLNVQLRVSWQNDPFSEQPRWQIYCSNCSA